MPTNLPLPLLIELAQNRTDDAAKRLGQLQKAQLSAADKLQLLLEYRADYLVQLQAHIRQGVSVSQLRNYQQFVDTLDTAIEQQRAITLHAHRRLDQGRSDWQQAQRQRQAYDTLSLRARQQAAHQSSQREQKTSDERASRPTASAFGLSA